MGMADHRVTSKCSRKKLHMGPSARPGMALPGQWARARLFCTARAAGSMGPALRRPASVHAGYCAAIQGSRRGTRQSRQRPQPAPAATPRAPLGAAPAQPRGPRFAPWRAQGASWCALQRPCYWRGPRPTAATTGAAARRPGAYLRGPSPHPARQLAASRCVWLQFYWHVPSFCAAQALAAAACCLAVAAAFPAPCTNGCWPNGDTANAGSVAKPAWRIG